MKVYSFACKTANTKEEMNEILKPLENIEKLSLLCLPEYFLGMPVSAGLEIDNELYLNGEDTLLTNLQKYAYEKRIYIASGVVEKDKNVNDSRFISGVLISPVGTIVAKQKKRNPTSYETKCGILSGPEARKIIDAEFGTVEFEICKDQRYFMDKHTLPTYVYCRDGRVVDAQVLPHIRDADVLLYIRGFGLNDPKYGQYYDKWLMTDRAAAIFSKAYLVGVTGAIGEKPLSDIINFEGDILAESDKEGLIEAEIDLELLKKYRNKEYESKTVPRF